MNLGRLRDIIGKFDIRGYKFAHLTYIIWSHYIEKCKTITFQQCYLYVLPLIHQYWYVTNQTSWPVSLMDYRILGVCDTRALRTVHQSGMWSSCGSDWLRHGRDSSRASWMRRWMHWWIQDFRLGGRREYRGAADAEGRIWGVSLPMGKGSGEDCAPPQKIFVVFASEWCILCAFWHIIRQFTTPVFWSSAGVYPGRSDYILGPIAPIIPQESQQCKNGGLEEVCTLWVL